MFERFHEAESLSKRFAEILEDLGIEDPYDDIDYDSLDEDVKEKIDALNLQGILTEQIERAGQVDAQIVRFVLRRLGQIDNADSVDLVLDHAEKLYAVFPEVVRFLLSLRSLDEAAKKLIGKRLIALVRTSIVGHLEYHRGWAFEVFAADKAWDNEAKLPALFNRYVDQFSRRALILALGRAQVVHWFKTRKRSVADYGPWEKRAFLAAASCLPGDESKHWYGSLKRSLDPLEEAVVNWATAHPFR